MPTSDDDKLERDNAAQKAEEELVDRFDDWTATELAKWWKTWYKKTGHRRLGRILLQQLK